MLLSVVVVGLDTVFSEVFLIGGGFRVAGRGGLARLAAEQGSLARRGQLLEPAARTKKKS